MEKDACGARFDRFFHGVRFWVAQTSTHKEKVFPSARSVTSVVSRDRHRKKKELFVPMIPDRIGNCGGSDADEKRMERGGGQKKESEVANVSIRILL